MPNLPKYSCQHAQDVPNIFIFGDAAYLKIATRKGAKVRRASINK